MVDGSATPASLKGPGFSMSKYFRSLTISAHHEAAHAVTAIDIGRQFVHATIMLRDVSGF
jgi:hypothetical protein